MKLQNVLKNGLAVVFASTLTLATIGCEPAPAPAPAPPVDGEVAPEGGSEAPVGEAVPE